MAATAWKRTFDDPIPLPRRRQFVTLEDAAKYIQKLPKAEQELEEWRAAVEAMLLVVEHNNGPTMMARTGVMRALNRHVVREFNPDRKDPHWGRRKLKRDRGTLLYGRGAVQRGRNLASIPFPKAPIPWLVRLIMHLVVIIQNLRNEFVPHNLLHYNPHKFGTGNSAFFCCLLKILDLQRNHDILDGHNISPMMFLAPVTPTADWQIW